MLRRRGRFLLSLLRGRESADGMEVGVGFEY